MKGLETQRSVRAAGEHVNLSVSRASLLHLINASVNRQTRCREGERGMALDGNQVPVLKAEGKRARDGVGSGGEGDRSKGCRLQIKRRNKRLIMHPASG